MNFGWWSIQIPLPVALAAVATLGYMVGHWRRSKALCPKCKQQWKQAVASESKREADGLPKSERIAT